MKTSELFENDDTITDAHLYIKAAERMFTNLGLPDILKVCTVSVTREMLKPRIKFKGNSCTLNIRFRLMKRDVEKAVRQLQTVPWLALWCATTMGHRWPPGEACIATDPWVSFQYAEEIIKGPWPEGEAAIATACWSAYHYAKDIIKRRFPEGEAAILTGARPFVGAAIDQVDPTGAASTINQYARDVIKGRWPEGEAALLQNRGTYRDFLIYQYAKEVIKGPWPEAGIS